MRIRIRKARGENDMFMMSQYLAFVCGSVLAVLIGLTVWDEDVLNVEHVLTIITVLGATVAGARVFIPGGRILNLYTAFYFGFTQCVENVGRHLKLCTSSFINFVPTHVYIGRDCYLLKF